MRQSMNNMLPQNITNITALDDDLWQTPPRDFVPGPRTPSDEDWLRNSDHANLEEAALSNSVNFPLLVVVACVIIPALVAAAIVFAIVRIRRSKHRSAGGIPYVECDDKSGQVNQAYKTPLSTSSVCYEKTEKVKVNLTRHVDSGEGKQGKIPISSGGGLFSFKDNDTLVSIPSHSGTAAREVHISFNTVRKVPDYVSAENILSDLITLLPHNATFSSHILVRLPVNMSKVKDSKDIQLMYSCTGEGEKPAWINLPMSSGNASHVDPIFWFLRGGYCYLFMSHFCHVFVTQFCSVLEQPALFLQASVHSQYDEELKEVKLHVGFHCAKCNPNLLKEKNDYGTLVGKSYKCIYGREGCIKVRSGLADPLWTSSLKEMDIETGDLLNLCNLDDIYPPLTFVYRSDSTQTDVVGAQVKITQGERKPVTIQGSVKTSVITSKKLQPLSMRKASDPVEHIDLSCSPREHSEDIPPLGVVTHGLSVNGGHSTPGVKHNDENTHKNSSYFSVELQTDKVNKENMSLPAVFSHQQTPKFITEPKRNGGSIFDEHVRYEEKELCRLLDESTGLLVSIAEELGVSQDLCVSQNFDGQRMLQVWKILVMTRQKTWIDLHSTLVRLKMPDAAHQLKMAYEKDIMI